MVPPGPLFAFVVSLCEQVESNRQLNERYVGVVAGLLLKAFELGADVGARGCRSLLPFVKVPKVARFLGMVLDTRPVSRLLLFLWCSTFPAHVSISHLWTHCLGRLILKRF